MLDFLAGVIITTVVFFVVLFARGCESKESFELRIVDQGFGEYYINKETQKKEFKYVKCKKCNENNNK